MILLKVDARMELVKFCYFRFFFGAKVILIWNKVNQTWPLGRQAYIRFMHHNFYPGVRG